MSRQTLFLALIVVACAVVVAIAAAPPQDEGRGPNGTVALRRFLNEMDLEVKSAGVPPEAGEGTYLLLADFRDRGGAEKILDWVEDGGRVVLASPDSEIAGELGVEPAGTGFGSVLPGFRTLRPECGAFAGTGVGEVAVTMSEAPLRVPRRAEACLKDDDGPHLALVPHGRGQVVVLAGRSALTNQYLDSRDNALMAYRLFAGFGPVVYGPPIDPGSVPTGGFWSSLPAGARSSVAVFVVALVVFVVVRGRRFGKPVLEQPLSPIPSSQLVGATAGLYQAAGAADFAGRVLRRGAARRMARKLGLPGNSDVESVRSVAGAVLEDVTVAETLSDREPESDEELIELAQKLNRLEEAVEAL